MTKYYPIFMDIRHKQCVVVGGGEVAERKTGLLLKCGAKVRIISPVLTPKLESLKESGAIEVEPREYRQGDIGGASLVIAATDCDRLNASVSEDANRLHIPVNVVDDPAKSSFIVPATFDRGDITIAVSTGGASPALAKKIRLKLEADLPPEMSQLVDLVGEVRRELKAVRVRVDADGWQKALNVDVLLAMLVAGKREEARDLLMQKLTECAENDEREVNLCNL
ncbi:MAG: bifunctional precorrin-2 dehydrogenase/sirohydrochlorin ferrochelatase [Chloroflexi bacterium]|nr:bifunctional precorrin-2 dehydrogenase/sirohydrochlorin ferrochelatase [Chloroflexota bacterium]